MHKQIKTDFYMNKIHFSLITVIALVFASSSLFSQTKTNTINVIGEPENLGSTVNSACYDYRPKLTADGNHLYFTRILCPSSQSSTDESRLFCADRNKDGSWGVAKVLDAKFNTEKKYPFLYSVSPDNNTLLLTLVKEDDKRGLFSVTRTNEGWSDPVEINLGITIPSMNSTFCLSNNGKVLILSYDGNEVEKLTLGSKDLYVSFLDSKGKWSKPKHMGDVINTTSIDFSPFIASDDKTLYFSSNRSGDSYGSNDIYMTKRLDDSWTNWSTPINLGSIINDSGWNEGLFIPASESYGYYNSEKNGLGKGDVFRIQLNKDVLPDPVVLISGKVVDPDGKPIGAIIKYEDLKTGKEVGIAKSISANGNYKITLPYGKTYAIYAEAKGYYSIHQNLDLTKSEKGASIEQTLVMMPLKQGQTIRINNLFFDTGSAELRNESFSELDQLVDILNNDQQIKIKIIGHTDDVGNDQTNLTLSQNRAKSVMDYLINKGVAKNRLQSIGMGEKKPVKPNDSDENRQLNRRVEFTVL